MKSAPLNDCFFHDKDRLKHSEAVSILMEQVRTLGAAHDVPLNRALGMVLMEDVKSPINVPLTDNAAVDGYAFDHASMSVTHRQFPVSMRIAAGDWLSEPLPPGTAARIFTGASMPVGADTVAMQEDCNVATSDADMVTLPPALKKGANCRLAGEDVKRGDALYQKGERLRPQDIAALASIGIESVKCSRPVRVAILSTGNELVSPGEPITQGQVYNSNGPLLESLCASLPVTTHSHGIVRDNLESVKEALLLLSQSHDVVLTTGGASRGDEDHVLNALDLIGTRHLWQLAIKPGRPMTFGHIGSCAFIGLPGNPVAAFVCFLLYARVVILRLAGAKKTTPLAFDLPAAFEMQKKPDRREFLRGFVTEQDGSQLVQRFSRDGSGLISSLTAADGLIEIPEDVTEVRKGTRLHFLPFSSFGL